jgi:hypothetical protein
MSEVPLYCPGCKITPRRRARLLRLTPRRPRPCLLLAGFMVQSYVEAHRPRLLLIVSRVEIVQGYLICKKTHSPRTLT